NLAPAEASAPSRPGRGFPPLSPDVRPLHALHLKSTTRQRRPTRTVGPAVCGRSVSCGPSWRPVRHSFSLPVASWYPLMLTSHQARPLRGVGHQRCTAHRPQDLASTGYCPSPSSSSPAPQPWRAGSPPCTAPTATVSPSPPISHG